MDSTAPSLGEAFYAFEAARVVLRHQDEIRIGLRHYGAGGGGGGQRIDYRHMELVRLNKTANKHSDRIEFQARNVNPRWTPKRHLAGRTVPIFPLVMAPDIHLSNPSVSGIQRRRFCRWALLMLWQANFRAQPGSSRLRHGRPRIGLTLRRYS